ncbi:hypothetical protein L207DRAFT_522323 [Hyaloscypha variabilis F]|uniref:Uncharacterized protein n=1 Tax=Hyaloscypha variabilis (strain UAMH 11265 / GT02V1 / F) TaxID=1149755 RepID=A0A2J6SE32_HYAVF|nr:hypothetical protein L207DRAFT_522323 [Hyaloscypha variabilis F]
MDPWSALNIATSVAQFLEFGCSLVSSTSQIYKSAHGATVSQAETTFAARRLLELSERMKASLQEQSSHNDSVEPPKVPRPPPPPPTTFEPPPFKPEPFKPPPRDDSTFNEKIGYAEILEEEKIHNERVEEAEKTYKEWLPVAEKKHKERQEEAEKKYYEKQLEEFEEVKKSSAEKLVFYTDSMAKYEKQMEVYCRGKESQKTLCEICDKCVSLSKELLARLNKLRVQGPKHRKFQSILMALKSVWASEELCKFQRRLESHRRELSDHLLAATCEKLQILSIEEPTDTFEKNERFISLDPSQQQSVGDLRKVLRDVVIEAQGELKNELTAQRTLLETMQKQRIALEERSYVERQRQLDEDADFAIINHLKFTTMAERREEIHEAHKNTCSWIYRDPEQVTPSANVAEDTRPWANFADWLQHGEEIYWVNGKAGSGKSTLMRYIRENPETLKHLRSWAGSAELRVASFYFWNSGSPEQRSQSGLFRSLLHDILVKRRDLVRHVFEKEWEASRFPKSKFDQISIQERVHSVRRLKEAFEYLIGLASDQLKLCFFIDGLDEYEGKRHEGPEAIIRVFKNIPRSPFLKICLSSRPWPEFEKAFDCGPSLRLQDLTYKDIRTYVYDKFGSDPLMLKLSKFHLVETANLVKEILSKANGVFLWVYLVVKSLLTGLDLGDEVSDLRNRLKSIPYDLEDLYQHMLNGIDKHYIDAAYRIFQIYNSASDVEVRPTLLELDLAVTATYADAMTSERKIMSEEEIQKRCDQMMKHLKVSCGGLLEAHDRLDSNWEAKDDDEDLLKWPVLRDASAEVEEVEEIDEQHGHKIKADAKVSYLHRTVRDYLKKDSVRSYLEGHTQSPSRTESFDPNLSLLMSYLINLKQSICSFYFDAYPEPSLDFRVWRTTNNVCHIAQRVDASKSAFVLALLHEFDVVAPDWWRYKSMFPGSTLRGRGSTSKMKEWQDGILCVAVRFGLCSFVEEHLQKYRMPMAVPGHTILIYALGLSLQNFGPFILLKQPPCPAMVELLLQHGERPNKVINRGRYTVWEYFLKTYVIETANLIRDDGHYERWALIFKSMLEHDADITDIIMQADPPDLHPWIFDADQDSTNDISQRHAYSLRHSLKALIQDLAAKAPPDAAASLRMAYQKRKPPSLLCSTPRPAGSSPSVKRPLHTEEDGLDLTGTGYIENGDDSDELSGRSTSRSRECLKKHQGTSPGKRTRLDLT